MFTVGSSVTLGDVPSLPVRSPHEPELSIAEIWHAQMEHQHFGHSNLVLGSFVTPHRHSIGEVLLSVPTVGRCLRERRRQVNLSGDALKCERSWHALVTHCIATLASQWDSQLCVGKPLYMMPSMPSRSSRR